MDTRAAIVEDARSSTLLVPMLTPSPPHHEPSSSFEDKLRQESILIPEDLVDIHINASDPATKSDTSDIGTEINTATDTPVDNTRYGKGKHWKRNLKKKQSASAAAAQGGCVGETTNQQPTECTIEQRREQVRPIIDKLTELQMNVSYPAIRELYKQLSQFIKTGEDAKIKIPFPEFSRRIKGELSNATYKPCWVKLEME